MSEPMRSIVGAAGRRLSAHGRATATAKLEALLASTGGRIAAVDRNPLTRRAALSLLPALLEQLIVEQYAQSLEATLELRIFESRGGPEVRYTIELVEGRPAISRRPAPDAQAWFGGRLSDLIRIATGAASWTELLAAGRLQLGGDPFTGLRVPLLFGFSPAFRGPGADAQ